MQPDLSAALAILRREVPDLMAAYVYGSVAAGEARPESDVDIAILASAVVTHDRLLDVREALSRALRRDVDLVDLRAAPTILQAQVIGAGRIIDAPDANAAAHFEVRVMGDYQALKARRAPIESDIVQRGRVHAG